MIAILFPNKAISEIAGNAFVLLYEEGVKHPMSKNIEPWPTPNPGVELWSHESMEVSYGLMLKRIPLFARTMKKGFEIDLQVRLSSWRLLSVAQALKDSGVTTCVFGTASAHHIDTSIVSGACELVGVRQVFLAPEILGNRLLPVEGSPDSGPRIPLGIKLNDCDYGQIIPDFVSNLESGAPPRGTMFFQGDAKVPFRSILRALGHDLKRLAVRTSRTGHPPTGALGISLRDHVVNYPFSEIDQVLSHRRALSSFRRLDFVERQEVQASLRAGDSVFIMGHFQPEATTFPEGGRIWDHADLVWRVRTSGYTGRIFFQEHPGIATAWDLGRPTHVAVARSPEFYERLSDLGCEFVPFDAKLRVDFCKSDSKVITMTGSVALERALSGKTTIVSGNPWFARMPGITRLGQMSEVFSSKVISSESLIENAQEYLLGVLNGRTLVPPRRIDRGETYSIKNKEFLDDYFTLLYNLP